MTKRELLKRPTSLMPKIPELEDPFIKDVLKLVKNFNEVVDAHLESGKIKPSAADVKSPWKEEASKLTILSLKSEQEGPSWERKETEETTTHGRAGRTLNPSSDNYRYSVSTWGTMIENYDKKGPFQSILFSFIKDSRQKNEKGYKVSEYGTIDLQVLNGTVSWMQVEYRLDEYASTTWYDEEAVEKLQQLLENFRKNP
jgi:hypothetical protein